MERRNQHARLRAVQVALRSSSAQGAGGTLGEIVEIHPTMPEEDPGGSATATAAACRLRPGGGNKPAIVASMRPHWRSSKVPTGPLTEQHARCRHESDAVALREAQVPIPILVVGDGPVEEADRVAYTDPCDGRADLRIHVQELGEDVAIIWEPGWPGRVCPLPIRGW